MATINETIRGIEITATVEIERNYYSATAHVPHGVTGGELLDAFDEMNAKRDLKIEWTIINSASQEEYILCFFKGEGTWTSLNRN